MDVAQRTFWVVDVEGNGATPPEIIELAMVEVAGLRLTGRQRHYLVRPEHPIDPRVTAIHGLTDDDVADAPSMEDIADDLLAILDHASIIGHNVRVEVEIIKRQVADWKPGAAIDTIRLTKDLRPGLASYSLENLGVVFGVAEQAGAISGRSQHSALYDAVLTALVFLHLLAKVSEPARSASVDASDLLNPRQGKLL